MSQHDFTVDNSTGLAVRNDINDAIQALATLSSGSTAPSTTFADQLWLDTSAVPPVLWVRNPGNTAWDLFAATNGFFDTRAAVAAATIEADVDIVVTQGYTTFGDGGGATYKRVGSDPSHNLKVQSSDAAWWEIVLDPANVINVLQAGVLGDDSTDNATALDNIKDYCIDKGRGDHWTFLFPAGIYQYTINRWIFGLKRVTLTGYGATLKCTSTSAALGDYAPFPRHDAMLSDEGDNQALGGETFESGYLLDTASAGDTSITLSTTSEDSNFSVGDRVLVISFAQQTSGYTPNLRYFDWTKITAISTGVLTIDTPLENNHLSTHFDVDYTSAQYGAARVVLLDDRTTANGKFFYRESIIVEGFDFVQNPNQANDNHAFSVTAEDVVVRDCNFDEKISVVPRECRTFLLERCTLENLVDIDKIGGHITISNCVIKATPVGQSHAIKAGTGWNYITVEDCNIYKRANVIAQRSLILRNNTIQSLDLSDNSNNGPVEIYNQTWGGSRVEITGNNLIKSPNQSRVVDVLKSFTIDGSTISIGTGDRIEHTATIDGGGFVTTIPDMFETLREGHVLFDTDQVTTKGIVTSVTYESAGPIHILNVSWYSAPVSSETYYFSNVNEIMLENRVVRGDLLRVGELREFEFYKLAVPTSDEILGEWVIGKPTILDADLAGSTAVIGTNPTATFALDVEADGTSIGTISFNTSGVATLTTTSNLAKPLAPGTVLSVDAPTSTDASAAKIAISMFGRLL